jgi:hypothetical protein
MRRTIFLFILVLHDPLFAQNKDSIALKLASYISVEELKNNLHVLASDEFEGRETGKKGQKLAAQYVAEKLKNFGVKESYQEYLLKEKQPGATHFFVNSKAQKLYEDFYYFPIDINSKKVSSKDVLFLGYGIEDSVYNDYQGVVVKNKTILILSGEPLDTDSVSIISKQKNYFHWSDRMKIKKAEEKGVKLVLIVKSDIKAEAEKNKHRIESPSMVLKNRNKKPTVIFISEQLANQILQGKTQIEELKTKINKQAKPITIEVNSNTEVNSKQSDTPVKAENVLGFIEGTELKEEVIVISAHYDHLGTKNGKVFNGADDDGSGTVALLELAKIFSEAKRQGFGPKRSILIIAFSGEEKGLLGSSYYVEHPYIPLQKTVCNLNIDMIGRVDEKHKNNLDYIYLIGSDKLSTQLHQISETANSTYTKLELDYTYNDEKEKNRFYYRSDHYNFAKNRVPVIFYFNGVHSDYHQETDDVEKIDFIRLQKRCSLVFFTAWELANRTERIVVDKQ